MMFRVWIWVKYQCLRYTNRSLDFTHSYTIYRSNWCHTCRKDFIREYIGRKSDNDRERLHVQELKCKRCEQRKPWWHFARLPVTKGEVRHIILYHDGRAW